MGHDLAKLSWDLQLMADPSQGFVRLPGSGAANRVDLVFVGDGYKAAQLDTYAERVDLMVAGSYNFV